MAKGKNRCQYLGQTGMVQPTTQINLDFLYRHSTARDPLYNVGDRVVLADGRVFRYAKADGTLQCDYGCKFVNGEFIEYSYIAAAQAIGDKQVTITTAINTGGEDSDGVFDLDELRGGYISIFKAGLGDSINRGIIGNSAKAATGTSIIVYLDAALDRVVNTGDTDAAEVLGNPYAKVKDTQASGCPDAYASIAGLPNVPATDGQYCWIQTWGPRWMSPTQSATGGATQERDVYFDTNGGVSEFTFGSDLYDRQRAGFLIDATSAGTDGAPFIMLHISP